MLTLNPFFSIIIPVYNRADQIGPTLQSVLDQQFKDFELLIVDDGSTDKLEQLLAEYTDPRIIYLAKKNEERGAARNFGVLHAKGSFITFLDSDDLLYPNHLFTAFDKLSNGLCDFFHLAYEIKDSKGNLITKLKERRGSLNKLVLQGNLLSCIGVFVRKELFQLIKFNEDRDLAGTEDWLLWLQFSARVQMNYSNKVTSCIINHEGRSVLKFSESQLLSRTNLLIRYLKEDNLFVEKWGFKVVRRINAHMLSYSALHLIMSGKKKVAFKLLRQAIGLSPKEIFQRRTLAIIKKAFFY